MLIHLGEVKANYAKVILKNLETNNFLDKEDYITILEQKIAQITGYQFAIATNDHKSALNLAVAAVNLRQSDEVILPTTYPVESIYVKKGKPVFYTSAQNIEQKVTTKTRAVIAKTANLAIAKQVCDTHLLTFIEDAETSLTNVQGDIAAITYNICDCCHVSFMLTNNQQFYAEAKPLASPQKLLCAIAGEKLLT